LPQYQRIRKARFIAISLLLKGILPINGSQVIVQTLAAPTATMNKNAGIALDAISYKLDLVNFNPRVGDSDTTA